MEPGKVLGDSAPYCGESAPLLLQWEAIVEPHSGSIHRTAFLASTTLAAAADASPVAAAAAAADAQQQLQQHMRA